MSWGESRELLSAVQPQGQTTRIDYDRFGMPIGETDALGQHTRTLWDSRWFEPLVITGPDGLSWRYAYDDKGLLTTATAPDGSTTEYAYDK